MSVNEQFDPVTQNIFGLTEWDPSNFQVDGQTQFFNLSEPLLSTGFGWAVIAGFSAVFAVLALFFVWAEKRVSAAYRVNSAEQFNTAGRQVGTGLIATDIVSHWTFPSVILSSVTYGYLFGVGAAMWTSTSGVVVVWLFAVLAIELKIKAPTAHTFLEVVKVRWGFWPHKLFYFIGIMTNLLVSINMLQGAVVVINALTGVNIYAICFVVPAGIAMYAVSGGLKSTFITSWIHTVIIFVTITIFYFKTFFGGGQLGSIDLVYNRLTQVPQYFPVSGNRHGSLLTAWSDPGLQLAVITTITGFSQLVTDQSYWQSAVAASPSKAAKGYLLGSLLYAAIMFSLPMCIGLAVWALDLPVAPSEVSNGLAFPATAYALIGKPGLYLTVVICFMAVTSCGAGEMVAVSSLITFDGFRAIYPRATNRQLVWCSRIGICIWAVVMGVSQTVVYKANIPVYLTGLVISVVLGSGVPPVVFLLTWRGCTALGACVGAVTGSMFGTMSWIVYTHIKIGTITAANLSANYALLTGAVVSLGWSILMCVTFSFIWPDKEPFQWERLTKEIRMTDEDRTGFRPDGEDSMEHLLRTRKWVWSLAIGAFFFLVILWPLLTLPALVWSLNYFKLMVYVFLILLLFGACSCIFWPLWESRVLLWDVITFQKLDIKEDDSLPITDLVKGDVGDTAHNGDAFTVSGKHVADPAKAKEVELA